MPKANIKYLDYYLPNESVTINELVGSLEQESIPPAFDSREAYADFAREILSMKQVRTEHALDEEGMMDTLLTRLFASGTVTPAQVELLITTEEPGQRHMDNAVKYLQSRHKMSNASVINLSGNHCSNISVALDFATNSAAYKDNVIIINGIKGKTPDDRIIGNYGILSDGAGIALLTKEPGLCTVIDTVNISNGALHAVDMNKNNSLIHYKYLTQSLKKLMTRNSLSSKQVAGMITQNANILLISQVLMEMGFDTRQIFSDNFANCGHVDSIDMIVNLKDVLATGRFKQGDQILCLSMGWAGSYVSSLIMVN